MKVKILDSELGQYVEQAWVGQWLHFGLFVLIELFNLLHGLISGWGLVWLVLAVVFYRYFFRALRELSYSYWTFAGCYGLLFVHRFILFFVFSPERAWNHLVYLLALGILAWQARRLFRPLLFPKVSWWEYDFRYRDDVKVFFHPASNPATRWEGRLIDWQKSEACLVAFGEFPLGEKLALEIAYQDQAPLLVNATIYSQRHGPPGRGLLYGIGLQFPSEQQAQQFFQFTQDWAHNSIVKKKRKYSDWQGKQ